MNKNKTVFIYQYKNHGNCIGVVDNIKSTEISGEFTHIRTKHGDLITIKTDYIEE